MSRNLLHMPKSHGGTGIPNWSICNLAQQLQLLQTSINTPLLLGFALQASMRASQLDYGHEVSFMESTDINMKGTTKIMAHGAPWKLPEILHQSDRGRYPTTKMNQCYYDIYIGELPTYTNFKLDPPNQCLFCEWHCHLHLTTVVNMVNATGT